MGNGLNGDVCEGYKGEYEDECDYLIKVGALHILLSFAFSLKASI